MEPVLASRPQGRLIECKANFFSVKVHQPIFHYKFTIDPEIPENKGKHLSTIIKSSYKKIVEKLPILYVMNFTIYSPCMLDDNNPIIVAYEGKNYELSIINCGVLDSVEKEYSHFLGRFFKILQA